MKNLLMLHGALSSKNQFDKILPLLKNNFDADAINFSGHGGEIFNPKGYSFPVFVNDVLKYADANKIEKLNLFGFSMGGYAALFFAKSYPEKVNKIFTLNTKFKWDLDSTKKEIAMLNAENMMLKVPSFANNLMLIHGLDFWKNVLQNTSSMMENLMKGQILTDSDFEKIDIPVLLSIGDRDQTSSIAETLDIYKKLKKPQLLVLPNTSHPFEKINHSLLIPFINDFFKEWFLIYRKLPFFVKKNIMKKLFTISIASLMISMAIFNACSKSSTTTSNNNNNNNNSNDTNLITINGIAQTYTLNTCILAGGSSNLFTMSWVSPDGNTTFMAQTYGAPTAGTYTIVFGSPTTPNTIQLNILVGATGAQIYYTAMTGTATVTTGTNPTRTMIQFGSTAFPKTGYATKTASGNMVCQ